MVEQEHTQAEGERMDANRMTKVQAFGWTMPMPSGEGPRTAKAEGQKRKKGQ